MNSCLYNSKNTCITRQQQQHCQERIPKHVATCFGYLLQSHSRISSHLRPSDESYETYIAGVNANKTCLITYVVSEDFTSREMLTGLIIMAHINNMNLSL